MEMATEVEAEEVIKDEEEEDKEISPDDVVEAVTTSSTVGKTTTSVHISQSKIELISSSVIFVEWETTHWKTVYNAHDSNPL
jgi:hypothetical protein